jgi:hypothetical protein
MTSGAFKRWMKPALFALALTAAATPETAARAADDPPKKQEELPRRQANYVWDKNEKTGQVLLKASFSYRDVVDKSISDKFASGIPQTVVMRAYVLREGDQNPIALAARTCTIKYDLWDEIYRVRIGSATHDTGVINLEGVLRQCAQAQDLVVADKVLLTGSKPFFLGAIVEVNPVSPQMLEQMKQWVARPAGSTGIGPGDALFGSFVGLFVRQIGTADKTLRFRTQSFVPP